MKIMHFFRTLTQTYVTDHKVANVERHYKDQNQQNNIQIQLPVKISGPVKQNRCVPLVKDPCNEMQDFQSGSSCLRAA